MAEMLPGFSFTGTIANISAYKMKGSDKIILRSKGGPSKKKIKTHPSFAVTRKNNSEFGGRSSAARWIKDVLWPIKPLADYNIIGPLNAMIKPIQVMDTVSELGKRNIFFTKNPKLLENFSLNKNNPFDSIIRNPLSCSLSKKTGSARIEIPALLPGINFFVPGKYPMFSIIATLGTLPDLLYTTNGYQPSGNQNDLFLKTITTEWFACMKGSPATLLELKADKIPKNDSFSLMLSVGIRFGTMDSAEPVRQIPYAGAGKILAMES